MKEIKARFHAKPVGHSVCVLWPIIDDRLLSPMLVFNAFTTNGASLAHYLPEEQLFHD